LLEQAAAAFFASVERVIPGSMLRIAPERPNGEREYQDAR
jgi:hypothetical protein